MSEPMIEQTNAEAEEFSDELSDEALDRREKPGFCGVKGGTINCVNSCSIE